MKKTACILVAALIALLCAGSIWAGDKDRGTGNGISRRTFNGTSLRTRVNPVPAEAVTVSGNLQLVEGRIAVVADGKTYYTTGIQRLVGFIDGLKEGASVRLEGSAFAVPLNSNAKFLRVTKLTFNGKTYDFPDSTGGFGRW
jgi:hypothetical protein